MVHAVATTTPALNSWEKVSMAAMAPYTVSAVTVTVVLEGENSILYLVATQGVGVEGEFARGEVHDHTQLRGPCAHGEPSHHSRVSTPR